MFDSRMIGIPNRPEKGAVVIELPLGWDLTAVTAYRIADVGQPVLTQVAVLSTAEAARVNADYRAKAQETLRTNLSTKGPGYIGQNLDESAVHGADRVEELLSAIAQDGYFSSWVLVERCSID